MRYSDAAVRNVARDEFEWSKEHIVSKIVARFVKDQSGATAIEYGLIASLIAVAIIGALTTLQTNLKGTFSNVAANLN